MKSVLDFKKKKLGGEKITMVTCYDNWSAQLLAKTDIDSLLIGDSLAMVVHGFDSTVHATLDMMVLHTEAVSRAQSKKFIVSDLPFLAHRQGKKTLIHSVDRLMKAGAQAIKIEVGPKQESVVRYLTDSGVPVIGHLGLTPQYVHQLGGYKVQGKSNETADLILQQAVKLEDAGAHAIVLECVPSHLAEKITKALSIPTIGIGAGLAVDGQVLVLQDLLGFNINFQPRFVRRFAQGEEWMISAINNYTRSVQSLDFPSNQESFL